MKKEAHGKRAGRARIAVVLAFVAVALWFIIPFRPILSADGPKTAMLAWSGDLVVQTVYGLVKGKRDKNGTLAWLGIPYASPPTGELRWKAPQPPSEWSGIRDATHFGSRALQKKALLGWPEGSEDCLYLNIWRPADASTDLPVYVWIHGGGNSSGASNAVPAYYGYGLASKARVIFVSINYRLGIFGWFSHPALREEADPDSASGNFGTLDIIKALRWIQENIAAFGGDPSRVTIAGESAGAFNILTLLVSPRAQGLFRQAVVESGYRTVTTKEKAETFANALVKNLLIRENKASTLSDAEYLLSHLSHKELAQWLRSLPAKNMLAAFKSEPSGMISFPYPVWDGDVLPANGFEALADAAIRVPIIIGTNKEETKIFQWLGRGNSKDPYYQAYADLSSARWKADGADSIADALTSSPSQPPVYVYRFDWGAFHPDGTNVLPDAVARRLGAFHSLEISFFLGTETIQGNIPFFNQIVTKENEKGRLGLQSQIVSYVRNFAWTGDPNKVPEWSTDLSANAFHAKLDDKTGTNLSTPNPSDKLPIWLPWHLDEIDPAFIVFDATLTDVTTVVSYGRMTRTKVQEMLARYPEPLQKRLREALEKNE
ncbi:MAG: carboxylesterase/lipase family protein [Rectinema subterraneum]|uniref:carboxylesterase/lipase family protein n=1 Tax=Rectinema subterraneum TaxID=2653714 RepID=UPI003C797890